MGGRKGWMGERPGEREGGKRKGGKRWREGIREGDRKEETKTADLLFGKHCLSHTACSSERKTTFVSTSERIHGQRV